MTDKDSGDEVMTGPVSARKRGIQRNTQNPTRGRHIEKSSAKKVLVHRRQPGTSASAGSANGFLSQGPVP
jgi:hypothetical protein